MGFFDPFGMAADVGELKNDLNSVKSDVETHTNNNDIHVTASDKSNWDNKLDKNQGTENSGKVLGTNANGEVIPLNGYGFEYDEETKMLKYGTDPTSNLNQGIGLDDTLSKRGYAADAGAVGELKEDIQYSLVSTEITNFGWTDNGYIRARDGKVITPHNYLAYTDIIPCEAIEGETIRIIASGMGVSGIAFYNSDTITDAGTFISGVETISDSFYSVSVFDVVVPKYAKSFRFSSGINVKNMSKVYIIKVGLYDLYNTFANNTKETNIHIDNHDYLIQCFRKIGVVGDSLASGEVCSNNSSSTNHDMYEHSWLQYMARYYGFTGINFSRGGLSTTTWLTSPYGLPLAQKDGNECQCYIIGLGANDMNYDIDTHLGTSADVGTDANTFYGNYSRIISELKAIQPKAKFFVITMSWLYTENKTYKDYCLQINEAIRYIAENTENCYLIDLENDDFYYTADVKGNMRSGHYNAIGYNMMGMHLAKIIGNYMYDHQDEFRQVEFIGTDYEWN